MTTEAEPDESSKQVDRHPKRFTLKEEFPFNSDVKLMSTVYIDHEAAEGRNEHIVVFLKGAVSLRMLTCHRLFEPLNMIRC